MRKVIFWSIITLSAAAAALCYFLFSLPLLATIMLMTSGFVIYRWHLVRSFKILHIEKYIAESRLKQESLLFDTLFEHTSVGTAILNLDGHVHRANKALCELLGYDEKKLLEMNFFHIIHANDLNKLHLLLQDLLDSKLNVFEIEQQCFNKKGETLWIMSTFSINLDSSGNPSHYILQVQDVTEKKKAEERFRHMAYHDPLTGLANRNKLEQFITQILLSSRRHQQSFAILFMDLDRFKNINDTLGHEAGDLLLQIISDRLRSVVRNTDMVARLGGDEFVILITDVKKAESVAIIAKKILESILEAIIIKGQEIYITTSIGISIYPYDGQNMPTLMKNSDLAMYRAKEHGRNNYQFYTLEMTSRAQEKMALQNALGHALVKNEFLLHYQPKMDLKTRRITGVEALLRWKNNEFGVITPDEIVSLAEETGLIIPVSDWVFKTAAEQLKLWQQMGFTNLSIAVNCSARQFKQGTFVDDIYRMVNEVGISPHALEVEVTEGIIMQDPDNTLRTLYALKDLGIQIVIDDFGTGYWSLGNLRKLSVDRIKIDKTFIKQVTIDETSTVLTSAIIALVNKLGVKAVAEGVETKEQYEFLQNEGCAEIQGYYLTHPLAEEAMTTFLLHPTPDAEIISQRESTT